MLEPETISAAEDAARASQRLRTALAVSLGLLAGLACITLATELGGFVWAWVEAQRDMAAVSRSAGGAGPRVLANLRFDWPLLIEAVVLQPLFLAALTGLFAFATRASFAWALTGLILYNVAAIGMGIGAFGLDIGWSPRHGLVAALVCVIGLPIAEFGLWSLFREGERQRYVR